MKVYWLNIFNYRFKGICADKSWWTSKNGLILLELIPIKSIMNEVKIYTQTLIKFIYIE